MSLLTEIGLGLYVGVLTGTFTAFLAFALSFGFRYVAGVNLSDRLGLMIGLGAAGLQGGFIGLIRDPEMLRSPTIAAALLTVMIITMYAHAKGKTLADALPRGSVTQVLWRRTLSSDAVERIGRFGQVRIRVQGEVGDVEGYPPLPDRLRTGISNGEWKFPADLPLSELESRLIDRLETEYDLSVVQADIDSDGRATIAAAPPSGALSRRVPPDRRAVSIETRLPSGIARGDEVELAIEPRENARTGTEETNDGDEPPMTIDEPQATTDEPTATTETVATPTTESRLVRVLGTVVSAPPAGIGAVQPEGTGTVQPADGTDATDADDTAQPALAPAPAQTAGAEDGVGRATVALSPDEVSTSLTGTLRGLLVRSKGGDAAFELVAMLRRQNNRFRKITVRPDSDAAAARLADLDVRGQYGVDVLAIRRAGEWQFTPSSQVQSQAGDELFAVGPRAGLDALAEVSA